MTEDFWPLFQGALIFMTVLMTVLWGVQWKLKNLVLARAGWAGGVALLGLGYAVVGDGYGPRRTLIGLLAFLWGTRLAWHLWTDRIAGKPEDPRFTTIRESSGRFASLKLFLFFEMHALWAVVLSYPVAILAIDPYPEITGYEKLGFLLGLIALGGEALADRQLKQFKKDPANEGRTCQDGLWYHSRHPNYFFDWLIWVAFFIASLATPLGWISILCPALMALLIFRVTGIPPSEAQALQTRGEDYREYQQTTNAFLPWLKHSSVEES